MSDDLIPRLRQRNVPTGKLILDPNNPRLITRTEDRYSEPDFADANVQHLTVKKLCATNANGGEVFHIKEVEKSIRRNGWVPADFIFVRQHSDGLHYIVLEGNRRVAAIRNILSDETAAKLLHDQLKTVEVMEIIDDLPPQELQRKITYLLGVRHHGSLVKWRKFARAHNIFKRYLDISKKDWNSFAWDETIGEEVADGLSISKKAVREAIMTYRAMKQVAESPRVRDSEGGVKDNHYSLFEEALQGKNRKLNEYLPQESSRFLLSDEAISRFDNLCHFSSEDREGAPVTNPQEWRKLEKILREEDAEEKAKMLKAVEIAKEKPSDVWARREAEVTKLRWDRWLFKVVSILKKVSLGDDLSSTEAKQVTQELVALVENLSTLDK